MTITDDDLSRWDALCAAATPGPWERQTTPGLHPDCPVDGQVTDANGEQVADCLDNRSAPDGQCEADADFIAATREGWPATIAEVRRLRGLGKRLEDMEPDAQNALLADIADRLEFNATKAECAWCGQASERDASGYIRAHTVSCEASPVVQERNALRTEVERLRPVAETALARRRAFHARHAGDIDEEAYGAARDAFQAALDAYEKEVERG